MPNGNKTFDLSDAEIKESFEVHQDIYNDNYHLQGLVILGVLVNSIMIEQQEKSSNFFSKISLDGIRPKRVTKLIAEVTKYLEIYKIYKPNSILYSYMMDRIQGIEDSLLTKDEVLFYVLTGISLGRYLGYKHASEKNNQNNQILEGEKNGTNNQ